MAASILEKMLLSEAACEFGFDPQEICNTLKDHALVEPDSLLTTQHGCETLYRQIMQDQAPDVELNTKELSKARAQVHIKVARKYYMERVAELRAAIFQEEERYKTLHREIEEIKAGIWDERITSEAAAQQERIKAGKRRVQDKDLEQAPEVLDEARENADDHMEIINEEHADVPEEDEEMPAPSSEQEQSTSKTTKGRKGRPTKIDIEVAAPHPAPPQRTSSRRSGRDAPTPADLPAEESDQTPLETPDTEEKASRGQKGRRVRSDNKRKRETGSIDRESEASSTTRSKKRTKTEDDMEAVSPLLTGELDVASQRRLKAGLLQIVNQVLAETASSVFREPVRKQEAPNYYQLIKKPMDLKTLARRVRDGTITNILEFKRDLLLIFSNAIMFNPPDSDVADSATKLSQLAETLLLVYESSF